MARSRNIKPGFFKDDLLSEVPPLGRLLLAGLTTIADREGRLEERPKRIRAEVLPYDEIDLEDLLRALAVRNFIVRYEVDGVRLIQIVGWDRDQNPHVREPQSTIPAPDKHQASTMLEPVKPETSMEPARRIPDSGFLIPDSVTSGPVRAEGAPGTGIGDSPEPTPEKKRGHPPSLRSDSRKAGTGPTEDEWVQYAGTTWPSWPEDDVRSAWAHYDARNWKKTPKWKSCAKTCYHRWASDRKRVAAAVAPARGAPSPAPSPPTSPSGTPSAPPDLVPVEEGAWAGIREQLRLEVDERDYDTWIDPLRQVGQPNGRLTLWTPAEPKFLPWLTEQYAVPIAAAARSAGLEIPDGVEFRAGGSAP